jgi:hypothetical protein
MKTKGCNNQAFGGGSDWVRGYIGCSIRIILDKVAATGFEPEILLLSRVNNWGKYIDPVLCLM